jgi:hypothetical protein
MYCDMGRLLVLGCVNKRCQTGWNVRNTVDLRVKGMTICKGQSHENRMITALGEGTLAKLGKGKGRVAPGLA